MPESKARKAIQDLIQMKEDEMKYFYAENSEVIREWLALQNELMALKKRGTQVLMNVARQYTKQ